MEIVMLLVPSGEVALILMGRVASVMTLPSVGDSMLMLGLLFLDLPSLKSLAWQASVGMASPLILLSLIYFLTASSQVLNWGSSLGFAGGSPSGLSLLT